ncbi:ComF family protein [Chloroflexota bacterium]
MSLSAQLNQFKSRVAGFLFPPHCLGCGLEGDFLCLTCRRALLRLLPPLCPRCGKPLSEEDRCYACQGWQPEINGIRSPFLLEGVMRNAIHQFKYSNYSALAFPLAELLAEYWETRPIDAEVIVPVPLHSRRLRERGYNQAALLAQELGKVIDIPVEEETLIRLKDTPAQVKASNADIRRNNVLGAFNCRNGMLEGKKILLIDDVCTTGATLDACASALNRVGAISVWGLTVAREI